MLAACGVPLSRPPHRATTTRPRFCTRCSSFRAVPVGFARAQLRTVTCASPARFRQGLPPIHAMTAVWKPCCTWQTRPCTGPNRTAATALNRSRRPHPQPPKISPCLRHAVFPAQGRRIKRRLRGRAYEPGAAAKKHFSDRPCNVGHRTMRAGTFAIDWVSKGNHHDEQAKPP